MFDRFSFRAVNKYAPPLCKEIIGESMAIYVLNPLRCALLRRFSDLVTLRLKLAHPMHGPYFNTFLPSR